MAWQVGRQRDFRGGETQARLPEEVGRNQLLRMENAVIFPDGRITAAHQADKVLLSSVNPGIVIMPQANGTYTAFTAPGNNTVYSQFLDTGSSTSRDMSAGSPHTVTGAVIHGISKSILYLGKQYCMATTGLLNLTDYVLTAIAAAGEPVKLALYFNRLWMIFSDGTARFSGNGSATSWDALDVLLLPNSEPIVNFFPVPGGAIAYSATAIYAMYGASRDEISFIPLMQSSAEHPKHFTSGSIEVAGTVYILSTEGVYAVSLNGAQLVPHHQEVFFQACFPIFSDASKDVSAVHLRRFNAIMFTWPEVYGVGQSFIFYLTGATSKVNRLLPTDCPFILGMSDANTDYLMGVTGGSLAKSEYPSSNMTAPQPSIVQTRHEDCDDTREKVWSCFTIVSTDIVYGVSVDAVVDETTTVNVASGVSLVKGENHFWLDDVPRSATLSAVVTVDNSVVLEISTDSTGETILTDDDGDILTATINPGNWSFKEFRLKYRAAGPTL